MSHFFIPKKRLENKDALFHHFQVKEFGACSVRIHNWQTWNGGMNGRLKVHLKEEPTMPTWSAFVVLDTDVENFVSYDGEVSTSEGKTFKIRYSNQKFNSLKLLKFIKVKKDP